VAVALVGATAGLAGCQQSDPVPPSQSPTGTATASTATVSPSDSSSATATTSATQPTQPADLPAAAKENTGAGAEAFVTFFWTQANRAWTRPQAGLLPPLCLPTSKSCAAIEKTAVGLVTNHQHYRGDPATQTSVAAFIFADAPPTAVGGHLLVDWQGIQEKRDVLDSTGHVVLTDQREVLHRQFDLVWTGVAWQIAEIKGVV
jgi:hypothetical protein